MIARNGGVMSTRGTSSSHCCLLLLPEAGRVRLVPDGTDPDLAGNNLLSADDDAAGPAILQRSLDAGQTWSALPIPTGDD